MCGLIGVNRNAPELMRKAAACIAYRGPDAYGSWNDGSVSFGFDRLSIIDLDARAGQPMWDDAHEIGIVFNGEIYNYRDLRAELETEFTFRTASDTEVLIYGYKKYGAAFAGRLRGMYAFVIYDTRSGMLHLFRDHAGIKPLLYFSQNGLFCFGSEMKALLTVLADQKIRPAIERAAIDEYLALGYVASPKTIYADIKKVPRGSCLSYDLQRHEITATEPIVYQAPEAHDERSLFAEIERSILEHTIADVPVGVYFSGGTDSSLIASVLHKKGIDLETFSVEIPGRGKDKRYFTAIEKELGFKAHAFTFTPADFEEAYEQVFSAMDEPSADTALLPTYFISKKARERVKVVLSGEGGDELFFGYYQQRALSRMRNAKDANVTFIDRLYLSLPAFTGKQVLFEKLWALFRQPISLYLAVMAPGRDHTSIDAWRAGKRAIAERSNDPLYFDRDIYLEGALLRKTDFATSLNSLEGRVPLLGISLWKSAPNFERDFLDTDEMKPVLKRMLVRYLPKELVYRPKSGFGVPLTPFLGSSGRFAGDVDAAIAYLKAHDLLSIRVPHKKILFQRYPNICFALVALYKTLTNNEKIITEAVR